MMNRTQAENRLLRGVNNTTKENMKIPSQERLAATAIRKDSRDPSTAQTRAYHQVLVVCHLLLLLLFLYFTPELTFKSVDDKNLCPSVTRVEKWNVPRWLSLDRSQAGLGRTVFGLAWLTGRAMSEARNKGLSGRSWWGTLPFPEQNNAPTVQCTGPAAVPHR